MTALAKVADVGLHELAKPDRAVAIDESHLSRLTVLREFVSLETELPGCCLIDVQGETDVVRISVDMRRNGATLVLGSPGQVWVKLDDNGNLYSVLIAAKLETITIDNSNDEAANQSVDALMTLIKARGRFVSIAEARQEMYGVANNSANGDGQSLRLRLRE